MKFRKLPKSQRSLIPKKKRKDKQLYEKRRGTLRLPLIFLLVASLDLPPLYLGLICLPHLLLLGLLCLCLVCLFCLLPLSRLGLLGLCLVPASIRSTMPVPDFFAFPASARFAGPIPDSSTPSISAKSAMLVHDLSTSSAFAPST